MNSGIVLVINNHWSRSIHLVPYNPPYPVLCYGMLHGIISQVLSNTHTHTSFMQSLIPTNIIYPVVSYVLVLYAQYSSEVRKPQPPNQLLKPSHTNPAPCLPVDPPLACPLDEATRSPIPHYTSHSIIHARRQHVHIQSPSCSFTPVSIVPSYPHTVQSLLRSDPPASPSPVFAS